jgi:hypothetical protein
MESMPELSGAAGKEPGGAFGCLKAACIITATFFAAPFPYLAIFPVRFCQLSVSSLFLNSLTKSRASF